MIFLMEELNNKTLFKDKIRLIHDVSERIRIYMHVLKLHLCIYHAQYFLNITPLYMVTDFKSCIYGFFSFTHDILLNKLTNYVHIVFWYQSRIYIYSMLVSLQHYNFIFGPNEYIILISIFSKCIQYKTDQKQSS